MNIRIVVEWYIIVILITKKEVRRMIHGVESILIGTQNPKKLADFYKNKVGLKLTLEAEMGDDKEGLFGFEMKGCTIYIMHHGKVKGKSKGPDRIIFNLEVDDIKKHVKQLDKARVKKIKDIYHVEDYGYVATFEDIDGNYFQLVKVRA